ncbi:ShTK domain protein [Trichostrongylus colubriformis]|uniref:ShTK domain protein n=1 Tax=Trichostrongylus colubriformis TaxID=6319 RepID=A0AAN8G3H4_TRICO
MFVHILCALVLLNAFTTQAESKCADYFDSEKFCWEVKRSGGCNNSKDVLYEEYMEICPKTCGFCRK